MKSLKDAVKKLDAFVSTKSKSRTYGAIVFAVAFAAIGTVLLIKSFAAGAQLYLTPATVSVNAGSDVTVSLRLDPAGSADSVDATVTYDQAKLQYKSVDFTNSAYPSELLTNAGNGTVHIVRFKAGGSVTTDALVANITFTALGTTSTSTDLSVAGTVANAGQALTIAQVGATVNINGSAPANNTAAYTIEPSTTTPVVGTQFGLKVFVTSNTNIQGGDVVVNLPSGVAYSGTLDTTGTAFNPATTVTGTTAQSVHIVFVTQSQTLTGKQLVATIPVTANSAGAYSVTFGSGARVADLSSNDITPVTADPFNFNVGASIAKPIVGMPGIAQLPASSNITDLKQSFTINNFDSAGTYTVTLGGQALALSGNGFSIPSSLKNGDYTLQVAISKQGTGDSASYTIRLRSPNVNRTGCVELLDLLAVNKAYGTTTAEFDLDFSGAVGLVDLLTVTGNWGGACV
jgi:hypothetical protein